MKKAPTIQNGASESQNALPDVVDEALFNLDHYRRLQLEDGGVRGGVEQEEHPRYGEASWQNSLETLTYAPDPWSSCLYAAAAAKLPAIETVYVDFRNSEGLRRDTDPATRGPASSQSLTTAWSRANPGILRPAAPD